MNNVQEILARKYAQAFLNCYGTVMTVDEIPALSTLESFLRKHQKILFFLSLSRIKAHTKKDFLRALFEQFNVCPTYNELARVLIDSKRGQLLHIVLKYVITIYKRQKGIQEFLIKTSHGVTKSEIETIEQFLARMIDSDIMYKHMIDKSLIAGIRLQSDSLLWEYSIRKQLNAIHGKPSF